LYKNTNSINDLPEMLLKQISHFFEHYKDLEANKWVKLDGWADVDAAKQEINDSVKRFNQLKEKPNF
jgi:inorganic pyrophosphatase